MPRILLVDDEENIRLLYAEELRDEGYEVTLASDGYKLLERIETESPDIIILDIKLFAYNGLDLLQEIRRKYYNLPVILCSAFDSYKGDIKSMAADNYVVKSSNLAELKEKIKLALDTFIP
ncbi:MAG: response regulator [Thermodesulfobacteriota bacterium]|nr:response regulator [Thermodesulfobacteriota bacterium]